MSSAPLARTLSAPGVDLGLTLSAVRMGVSDPCMVAGRDGSWVWASRTPAGPVTVRATARARGIRCLAWGDGAEWALARGRALVGAGDPTAAMTVEHPAVDDLLMRFAGLRLVRTHRIADAAIAGICRWGVSAFEAARAWSLLVEAFGDPAPGPGGLSLPPSPERLADAAPYDLHVMGLENDRAAEVRRVASHASRLVDDGTTDLAELHHRLTDVPGIGDDTLSHARCVALGDATALPIVDAHVRAALARVLGTATTDPRDLDEVLREMGGLPARIVRVVEAASAIRP